ncbi:glycoside hydrolase family 13 protein [Undibacterium pigrum]|uniref:Glycosidase n=1 Tax=Undibacterium pigrum TaxID=401470 RepID=A0A318IT25_9BURK|nr:glycoside hydrolase family 13 protein [Undibacterium pigrum]PXX38649.1 glycosidase [Undibacterium pigrum]
MKITDFVGLSIGLLALLPVYSQAQPVMEHVEPGFWWVGMKTDKLQIMLHGKQIASYTPRINYPGVRIKAIHKLSNPNYLFLDLQIAPASRPGKFDIRMQQGSQQFAIPYELKAREKGAAERRGFGPADVILNLMPDRFANGDTSNDRLPGFADKLDRNDASAGRHGGDLKGIRDHLDYIAGMGYTMLWPTPIVENNQQTYSYHGYAATDYYKVDARLGSNEEYRQLIAEAKKQGIGVIQDIVLNHIGDGHWWMKDLPSKDWLSYNGEFVPTYHARTTASDPYASAIDKKNFTQGWFEVHMPDMNQRNPLVANYQIQNTIWWIEYAGLAGIRADTYGYSDPGFLSEWSRRVMQEYPQLTLVGEEWSDNPNLVAHWLRGHKNANGYISHMPSMMDYPLHDTLRKALVAPENLHSGFATLYEALVNDQLYPKPSAMVLFEGNHDVSRLYSALDEDLDLFKMAITYVATMPRTPQFYYGTEILMTSTKHRDDGAFRKDFPGGWAGDAVNAFTGAGLNAKQLEAQAFVKKLLSWRKTQSSIHNGKLMHFAPQDGIYVYFRYDQKRKIMVVMNKNTTATELATARFAEVLPASAKAKDVFSGQEFELAQKIKVPARGVLLLEIM